MGLVKEEDFGILGSDGVWIRVVLKPNVAIENEEALEEEEDLSFSVTPSSSTKIFQ